MSCEKSLSFLGLVQDVMWPLHSRIARIYIYRYQHRKTSEVHECGDKKKYCMLEADPQVPDFEKGSFFF